MTSSKTETINHLRGIIDHLEREVSQAYSERNTLVALITTVFPSWLGRHSDDDDTWDLQWRNIIFVELPTGQASWHIHDSELYMFAHLQRSNKPWDGHTTTEKYQRVKGLISMASSSQGND